MFSVRLIYAQKNTIMSNTFLISFTDLPLKSINAVVHTQSTVFVATLPVQTDLNLPWNGMKKKILLFSSRIRVPLPKVQVHLTLLYSTEMRYS